MAQSYREYQRRVKAMAERTGGSASVQFFKTGDANLTSIHRKVLDEMGIVNICCSTELLTMC